jgi:uncharacterized iron-regulated membrane protein
LWTGIGIGLYVLLISLSGSAIVFRRELDKALCPATIMVSPVGRRMTDTELADVARATFLRFRFTDVQVRGPRVPGAAVEVWFESRAGRVERLFDPYTGRNLGDTVACEPDFISKIADFHDKLWSGNTGLLVNGAGALLLTLICLTGAIIWWPGSSRWRRSMTLRWGINWRRFTWDLHSVLGFWMFILVLLWAVSGIYFGFPDAFNDAIERFRSHGADTATSRSLDAAIYWLVQLHFGRSFGLAIKILWAVLGLVPCGLFVTGGLMWWNRVLRRAIGRSGEPLDAAGIEE